MISVPYFNGHNVIELNLIWLHDYLTMTELTTYCMHLLTFSLVNIDIHVVQCLNYFKIVIKQSDQF